MSTRKNIKTITLDKIHILARTHQCMVTLGAGQSERQKMVTIARFRQIYKNRTWQTCILVRTIYLRL